jgi:hypothetical protein
MIHVICDVCLREAPSVRAAGKIDIPPGWIALSAVCCPHAEVFACENQACQQRAARALLRLHESSTLAVRKTMRQEPKRPSYWTEKIR